MYESNDDFLRELDEMSAKGEIPKLISDPDFERKMQESYFKSVREYLDPRFIESNSEEKFDENIRFIGWVYGLIFR